MLTQSGLVASVLMTDSIIFHDLLHEAPGLGSSARFEMSSSSLKNLTKTQMIYPMTVIDLIERGKNLIILAEFSL